MNISFEPLSESHFPIMLKWLETPHVKKWWDQDIAYSLDLVKEKYGSYVQGYKQVDGVNKPIHAYVINAKQASIGYIQIYNAYDFPRSIPLSGLPENLGAFDIFIGEEKYLGKNLGSEIISKFLSLYGTRYSHIFADPDSNNLAAIKAYEKAGFIKFAEQKSACEVWMIWKKEANWELYYIFEDIVYKGKEIEIKRILDQFDVYDFLSIPIIFDLVDYRKVRLLKLLHKKGVPLTYEEWCGGNALHVACGAGGDLECVKFFIEHSILTDINKKSSKFGDTPLNLAISYEHKDILKYFKRKFGVNGISFDDLDVALDRLKSNYRKIANRQAFFKHEKDFLNLDKVLEELKAREPIFHHPDKFGKTEQDILDQMCDEFCEVGASGNIYTKQNVIDTLLVRYNDPAYEDIWETKDFEIKQIAPNNYLLTYTLIQNQTRATRRSTIWRRIKGTWKILYHQGTVINDEKQYNHHLPNRQAGGG